ncbi:MAG: cytochrome c [Bacteroidetes bacterium]|nr:cytochrome c [Bacteroidota bacterium]
MKIIFKFLKWVGIGFGLFVLVMTIFVMIKKDRTFDAPYPKISAVKDSLVIQRGKNLVYGAAHCAYCHAPIEKVDAIERGEIVPLSGGHVFDIPPAKIITPNITADKETGIGNWPDSVLARSLRYMVGHDGRALLEFMPFQNLSDSDLTAIISYLRTTEPVKNTVPKSEWRLLGNILKALVIEPVGPSEEIQMSVKPDSTIEYGKYLAQSVANCRGCHTDRDMKTGKYVGPFYAGGFKMPSEINPALLVVSPNITTDPTTGRLANMSENDFIQRFKKGTIIKESMMPWGQFKNLSELELKAIYRYLASIPPIANNTGPVLIPAE